MPSPYEWPDDETEPGETTPAAWVPHSMDLFKWVTSGTNCPACQVLSGRVYPLAYWQATVMPGWHDHCDCRISAAGTTAIESPHDLWGTEPLWWNPLLNAGDFIGDIFSRIWDSIVGREWWKMEGDQSSGMDNKFPIFMSQNWITSAQWTLKDYKIRAASGKVGFSGNTVQGKAGFGGNSPIVTLDKSITGNVKALLNISQKVLKSMLPWEAYEPLPYD